MEAAYTFTHSWWAQAIRGILAILFGLAAIFWPGLTLVVLVALFGAYAFVDGIFAIVAGVRLAGRNSHWWWLLLEGIVGILAGIAAFFWPGATALILLYIIAAWAIISGVFELIAGFQRELWWFAASGILSVIFGILLIVFPGAGALSVVWLIGTYALIFGVLMLVHAFQMRGRTRTA